MNMHVDNGRRGRTKGRTEGKDEGKDEEKDEGKNEGEGRGEGRRGHRNTATPQHCDVSAEGRREEGRYYRGRRAKRLRV